MGNSGNLKDAANKLDKSTLLELKTQWHDAVGDQKKECNFKQFSKMLEGDSMTPDECRALFQVYDINKNGTISWNEFVGAVALVTKGSFEEKVSLVFNSFDANGDGKVTRDELAKAVRLFSDEGSDFVNKVFKSCDKNGDGSINNAEFTAWVKQDPEAYATVCSKLNIEF